MTIQVAKWFDTSTNQLYSIGPPIALNIEQYPTPPLSGSSVYLPYFAAPLIQEKIKVIGCETIQHKN